MGFQANESFPIRIKLFQNPCIGLDPNFDKMLRPPPLNRLFRQRILLEKISLFQNLYIGNFNILLTPLFSCWIHFSGQTISLNVQNIFCALDIIFYSVIYTKVFQNNYFQFFFSSNSKSP